MTTTMTTKLIITQGSKGWHWKAVASENNEPVAGGLEPFARHAVAVEAFDDVCRRLGAPLIPSSQIMIYPKGGRPFVCRMRSRRK